LPDDSGVGDGRPELMVISQAFLHQAFFYAGEDEFLAGTLPFVREGVRAGEAVLVLTSDDKARLLEAELADDAGRVEFADMSRVGRNPARLLPLWRKFVDDHTAEGRPVRGIGEPAWHGRTAAELTECVRHESLLNLAFADTPAWRLLCPYDAQGLDDRVLREAELTHPRIADDGGHHVSEAFDPEAAEHPFDGALPDPPARADELRFTSDRIRTVRGFVSTLARDAHLDPNRTADLAVAVNELATNSVRHAGGEGVVRAWRDGPELLCEVEDTGRIEDPFAGRVEPTLDRHDGRGLWLVNQVCDLVQIRSLAGKTAVRVHMRLS
jgi:anti-sigma regulatory factor (Ser/Thr protein kinase)